MNKCGDPLASKHCRTLMSNFKLVFITERSDSLAMSGVVCPFSGRSERKVHRRPENTAVFSMTWLMRLGICRLKRRRRRRSGGRRSKPFRPGHGKKQGLDSKPFDVNASGSGGKRICRGSTSWKARWSWNAFAVVSHVASGAWRAEVLQQNKRARNTEPEAAGEVSQIFQSQHSRPTVTAGPKMQRRQLRPRHS